MPRSWYQGARQLIDDVRETFRLHFRQAVVHSLDVDVEAYDVAYDYEFDPESYGGVLIPQKALVLTIPLYAASAYSKRLSLAIDCPVRGETALFQEPSVLNVPCVLDIHRQLHASQMLPRTVPYQVIQGLALPWPVLCSLPSQRWLLKRHVVSAHWAIEKLKAPRVLRTPPMRSRVQLYPILKKAMPVQRKPIPPHRFPTGHRQKFRELLAARAQLSVNDMQIVGVYDRIFLGLFQSLSQREDGTLVCTPKSLAEPGLREKETVAVYLIVGKSFKVPGKVFQVVVPMSEFQNNDP